MASNLKYVLQLIAVVAGILPFQHAGAQSDAGWTVFTNGSMSVEYPSGIFPIDGGNASPPGSVFATSDGRARLHIFTVLNEREESPEQFLNRLFPRDRRELDYDRVTTKFFALSENKGDRILYRRCNFSNHLIHCIDLNYPR